MALYLKRQYERDGDKIGKVNGVKVLRARRVHHFTPDFVQGGAAEGWLSLSGGRITIHGVDGDVVYVIVRAPGHYCCFDDAALPDAGTMLASGLTIGSTHVKEVHENAASPDPSNPSGYRKENFYTGVLEGEGVEDAEGAAAIDARLRTALAEKTKQKYGDKALRMIGSIPPISGAADFVFNIAKGRVAELYNRVDLSDPTNAVLVILVLATSGIESDAVLKDVDTVTALVAGTTNEVTNSGYARKVLSDSDVVAFAPDDTNDRVDIDIPDQTWTAVAAGDGWNDLVVSYDSDSTGGADTAIVPLTLHDFVVTPDGSDITAQIATAGFFRAS